MILRYLVLWWLDWIIERASIKIAERCEERVISHLLREFRHDLANGGPPRILSQSRRQ